MKKAPKPAASALPVSDVISALEKLAPSGTSEKWDNTGLLAGDPAWTTTGAVVSIDLTHESIETAKALGHNLIVTHHPCIFPKSKGLSKIIPGAKAGISHLVFDAIRNGIAVAAYHTNFDQCSLEVVRTVSEGLGLTARGRLHDAPDGSLTKLVVFVPQSHLSKVRDALAQAGAGHIGNYDSCTFGTAGEGTFRGGKDAKPFVGKPGRLEKAKEVRLETIFPKGLKKPVLAALRAAHPYEEVAYDLYPVEQGPAAQGLIRGLGYGFWGDFPKAKPFPEVAKSVRTFFNTHGFWLTDPPSSRAAGSTGASVKRVAFVAGKGASFVDAALAADCDLFITGEAGYHVALDAARRGMSVLELGHRESEIYFIQTMGEWLAGMGLKTAGLNLKTQTIVTEREEMK